MTYNPADYAAVLNEAKAMPKDKLEKAYTNDRSKRHLKCWEVLLGIGLGLFVIFMISICGYVVGIEYTEEKISEKIEIVTNEICPMINGSYISPEFFRTTYDLNKRIICD